MWFNGPYQGTQAQKTGNKGLLWLRQYRFGLRGFKVQGADDEDGELQEHRVLVFRVFDCIGAWFMVL